ncbi:MAG TPA: flagellar basal body P-ring formation chaperone FlgA [Alphaproteobacteria bacterium]|nr:flagellar basal body P-ring formation chaperone FlgA [Alphaproteobacteria bacterium]
MLNKFWFNASLTVRITLVLLALICGSATFFIGVRSAMAATLKSVSIVNDDSLKLGDIFDGLKHNADYVIGPAPQPGQDMVLNARTLYRIAVAMNLPWKPNSSGDQIVIRREATVVPYTMIENSIRNKLKEKGVSGNINIALNNGKPTIVLPHDLPENAEVTSLNFDFQKDYFEATIVAPSKANPVQKILVSGMVERMVPVPVLRSNMQNGDIIGENDIKMINVNQKSLQHDIVLDKEDMIGLTPRRLAYAEKFVLEGMLEKPQLVGRGDKVSITYREGPLVLTAKGKALQSGAKGDIVRVTNINSSRSVDALVVGENLVVAQ